MFSLNQIQFTFVLNENRSETYSKKSFVTTKETYNEGECSKLMLILTEIEWVSHYTHTREESNTRNEMRFSLCYKCRTR